VVKDVVAYSDLWFFDASHPNMQISVVVSKQSLQRKIMIRIFILA